MINSVMKAIDILQAFSPTEPRVTLAEIAGRLGMPKSTTHNLLATLLACGFVEKVDTDHYALGTAVVALTQAVRVNVELRDRAGAAAARTGRSVPGVGLLDGARRRLRPLHLCR